MEGGGKGGKEGIKGTRGISQRHTCNGLWGNEGWTRVRDAPRGCPKLPLMNGMLPGSYPVYTLCIYAIVALCYLYMYVYVCICVYNVYMCIYVRGISNYSMDQHTPPCIYT